MIFIQLSYGLNHVEFYLNYIELNLWIKLWYTLHMWLFALALVFVGCRTYRSTQNISLFVGIWSSWFWNFKSYTYVSNTYRIGEVHIENASYRLLTVLSQPYRLDYQDAIVGGLWIGHLTCVCHRLNVYLNTMYAFNLIFI